MTTVEPGQVWVVKMSSSDPDPWYYLVVAKGECFTKLLCLTGDTRNDPGAALEVSSEWFSHDNITFQVVVA